MALAEHLERAQEGAFKEYRNPGEDTGWETWKIYLAALEGVMASLKEHWSVPLKGNGQISENSIGQKSLEGIIGYHGRILARNLPGYY